MRILVDTSVWSAAFRRQNREPPWEARLLRGLIEAGENLFLTGVILQELLQGIRDPRQFDRLAASLNPFPLIEPTRDDHRFGAELFNRCRSKGYSASTIDLLIAGLAIRYECFLFTVDRDFQRIAPLTGLKLLEAPYRNVS